MVNVYAAMLSSQILHQLLLHAGFTAQTEANCFQAGQIHVRILDAPRLVIHSPSGVQYVTVLSAEHLQQIIATSAQPFTLPAYLPPAPELGLPPNWQAA